MRRPMLTAPMLLIASVAAAPASEALELEDETARINYSLGYQIGGDFQRQGVEMNAEAVVKGIEDALSGAEPLMNPEDMRATLVELKRKVVEEQRKQAAEQRKQSAERQAKISEESQAFLEQNAKEPGVTTTASGLQYQIIEEGTGKSPAATDKVTVNYRGTTVEGNEFDSSYARGEPASFPLNGVIKGWTEGLQLVKEGGKIKLFIPPELAYGKRGPLANRALIFDVELVSVGEPEQTAEGDSPPAAPAAGDAAKP